MSYAEDFVARGGKITKLPPAIGEGVKVSALVRKDILKQKNDFKRQQASPEDYNEDGEYVGV